MVIIKPEFLLQYRHLYCDECLGICDFFLTHYGEQLDSVCLPIRNHRVVTELPQIRLKYLDYTRLPAKEIINL